jgi:hypothetical protein
MKGLATLAMALLITCPAFSQALYWINFNDPAQQVGQVVNTGTGSQSVSRVVFGSPTVVSSFGALTDQPLRLDLSGTDSSYHYSQIGLNFSRSPLLDLDLSFDFTSAGMIGSHGQFALFFDTSSVQNIYFGNNGRISLFSMDGSKHYTRTDVGSFSDGEAFSFGVHIDVDKNQWSVYKNGSLLGQAPFNPGGNLGSIRFSYGTTSSVLAPDSSGVAIDNLVVQAPEPAGLPAISAVLALLWLRFKKPSRRE